ncbi:DUF6153 family protein [Streptomyces sp. NPDC006475]|uniref:DUF6153 family protein n=1 Tax=Streptomyces sp. NPDC006475 TaxID=3155719 RepID=UPI00339E241F
MSRSTIPSRRPPGRLLVPLVMAVVAGVLGMHALAPGGLPATSHADAGHSMVTAQTGDRIEASAPCSHTDGGADHLDHADGTCSAAGIGSGYTPPALPAALAAVVSASWHKAPDGARAPPDLAELQLLRI